MDKPEYIQVQVTKQEKDLLRAISDRKGRIGFSGVIRSYIHEEAKRFGLENPQPQPVTDQSNS